MNYWLGYFLLLFLVCGSLITILVLLRKRKNPQSLLENLIIMFLAFFMIFMALEFYFKIFFAQMDSLHTLARQNWYERYYDGAINSLGYRDVEWTNDQVVGKIKVMVVGDSFAEGVGVENVEDRFSNQLAQKLGPDYVVFNVAKRGANTPQEIDAILNYPFKPDIIVLSYFINDIEDVRWWYSEDRPPTPSTPPYLLPLVDNSYLANFVYWRLYRVLQGNHLEAWWDWLVSLYNDPDAWWLHQQDLLTIYQGARAEHLPLLVVVFPNLGDITGSAIITDRVVTLFTQHGVPTLDVSQLIADVPTEDLMISPVDAHPSVLVHHRVAEALYAMFVDLNLHNGASGGAQVE